MCAFDARAPYCRYCCGASTVTREVSTRTNSSRKIERHDKRTRLQLSHAARFQFFDFMITNCPSYFSKPKQPSLQLLA